MFVMRASFYIIVKIDSTKAIIHRFVFSFVSGHTSLFIVLIGSPRDISRTTDFICDMFMNDALIARSIQMLLYFCSITL